MHVSGRDHGFSLLEVVIAAGLMLLTVTVVTLCVGNVSRADARLERVMAADHALRSVAERLRGLPFWAPESPIGTDDFGSGTGDPEAPHLVGAVFPHAQASRNTATARYVDMRGDPFAEPGSFVTLVDEGGVEVRCVARFARSDGSYLGVADVAAWDGSDSSGPPAADLAVTLTAGVPGGERTLHLRFSALGRLPVAGQDEEDAS